MIRSAKRKHTLITGASSGIGEAFAHEMASRGSHLILLARSAEKLESVAEAIRNEHPGIYVLIFPGDLTDRDTPAQLSEMLRRKNIHVDILVNNAGFGKWSNFTDEELITYENMLEVNINAVVRLTYLFLPPMLKKGEGGVINISSTGAFQPCPYVAVYCASKSFVLNFSEALYGEFREKGITVTAVCPGNTRTPFFNVANAVTEGMSFVTPRRVAEEGINAFLKGKNYKVTGGIGNYIQSNASRFLPRKNMIRIVKNMFKDRINKNRAPEAGTLYSG